MNGIILNANEIFLKAMDYSLEEIKRKHHSIFCDEKYALSDDYKVFWQKLNEGKFDTAKYLRYGKNNKKVWIQATYTPILDIDKNPVKVVKFAQDITQFEVVKKDQLTGLFNREKLLLDIQTSKKNNLAIIDINNFSFISDFYGYEVGDQLILKFSKIIKELLNEGSALYRTNSNKFAVLNESFSKKQFLKALQELFDKIKNISILLDIEQIHPLVTFGVSFEEKKSFLILQKL